MIGITTAGVTGVNKHLQELKTAGVEHIDCSVTSILGSSSVYETDINDVLRLREKLDFHDVSCNSLQSIFYGVNEDLNNEARLSLHLNKCFDIIEALSCNSLLFGSPQQRKNLSYAARMIVLMNELAKKRDRTISIENLDTFPGVWGQTTLDIQEEISRNSLSNCSINLHIFVEDEIDFKRLDLQRVSSIHLSNKAYNTEMMNINFETLSKAKMLYGKVPKLSLEFVNCSVQDCLHSFEAFREKWELL